MVSKLLVLLFAAHAFGVTFNSYDSAGYYLPSSGTASTTQFYLGTELSSGTACGVDALPNGKSTSGKQGGGPGYLYAAINQLAFADAGGPGGACGICYQLTPVSSSGTVLSSQALTFMIVDECPAAEALSGGYNCDQCTISETNVLGQHWNFDIAIDAMSTSQYDTFFNGVTDGSNWLEVQFSHVSCSSSVNPTPSIKSWGCISGCSNNDAASVCADV
ncbi:glycoside hydrolase family 45 protein [Hyaloscypha hepaticicola]|uniref:Glycoside hydrolase family 45 protein n=1 Tax=Hyaloscypha hepaticicola TaxID=2082293 RepID=A0A2J6QP31_9HELO|nr:glycoside hydrolase family 45 protein [Hyaloscypha hepaticicola]